MNHYKSLAAHTAALACLITGISLVRADQSEVSLKDLIPSEDTVPPRKLELASDPPVEPTPKVTPTYTPVPTPTPPTWGPCSCSPPPTPTPDPIDTDVPPTPTPTPDTSGATPPFTITVYPFI